MPLSALPYLEVVAFAQATIFVGFGVLWFIDIPKALSFFEIKYPRVPLKGPNKNDLVAAKLTMDLMAIVYGIRDIFMGAAIYIAIFAGTRIVLGWMLVAAGMVAGVDGVACKVLVGMGQMNHWSYAPILVVLGSTMLGALDWIPV